MLTKKKLRKYEEAYNNEKANSDITKQMEDKINSLKSQKNVLSEKVATSENNITNYQNNINKSNEKINSLKEKRANIENASKQFEEFHKSAIENVNDMIALKTDKSCDNHIQSICSKIQNEMTSFCDNSGKIFKKGHKNTEEYSNMIKAANDITKLQPNNFSAIKTSLQELIDSSTKYIEEKNSQIRPFPSAMRQHRLNQANAMKQYAENMLSLINAAEFDKPCQSVILSDAKELTDVSEYLIYFDIIRCISYTDMHLISFITY